MNIPRPTTQELENWNKVDYFTRLIDMDLHKKHKIELIELTGWIHHNYESVIHTGNELDYKKYKKLTK